MGDASPLDEFIFPLVNGWPMYESVSTKSLDLQIYDKPLA